MRFRKLRIAWSVFWGLAAVLLIVLWVRSYWWHDNIFYHGSTETIGTESAWGTITLFRNNWSGRDRPGIGWTLSHDAWVFGDSPELATTGFHWLSEPTFFGIWLPHWFVTLVVIVLATVVWLPWSFAGAAYICGISNANTSASCFVSGLAE
jgi:hypothetical protein